MTDSELIKSLADEYYLEVNGVKFWTPYWREGEGLPATNKAEASKGPMKGKGTPEQIQKTLLELAENKGFNKGEEWRRYMRMELHLGVECSGFIYYVLSQFLEQRKDIRLQDHLYKSRKDLVADFDQFGSAHKPEVTRELLMGLSEQVSLSEIQKFWGNNPRYLAGIKILTDDAASVIVNDLQRLRPGDQIAMMGLDGVAHSLLVVDAGRSTITYVHSGGTHGRPNYYGGVEYGEIIISDASKPIGEQEWLKNGELILKTHKDFVLRRLKVLDDGVGLNPRQGSTL